MADVLSLTQGLIRIPSLTPDGGDCIGFVESFLKGLGFQCQRLDAGGTANLYGTFTRGSGPHLAFAGHTDVVPAGNEEFWTHPPFGATVHDGILFGRGAADMKGAIAAYLAALEDFLKTPFQGTLSLMITGDEEGPATHGTPHILKHVTAIPDLCLIGEPASDLMPGDQIKIGRRGSLTGTLTVCGAQGHIAYPHLAKNPIPLLMNILQELYNTPLDQGTEHFDPSHFEVTSLDVGNGASNVIPGEARASFGIRFNDRQSPESLIHWLNEVIEKHTSDFILETRSHGPVFYNAHRPSIDLVSSAIGRVTGQPPRLSTSGGTSDGRFISRLCPVIECGLSNATIHQVDEQVPVSDLEILKNIYGEILRAFFSQE